MLRRQLVSYTYVGAIPLYNCMVPTVLIMIPIGGKMPYRKANQLTLTNRDDIASY